MLNYLDTQNILFTRAIKINIELYLFVAQVVLGEDKAVAYGMMYTEDKQSAIDYFNKEIKTTRATKNDFNLNIYAHT